MVSVVKMYVGMGTFLRQAGHCPRALSACTEGAQGVARCRRGGWSVGRDRGAPGAVEKGMCSGSLHLPVPSHLHACTLAACHPFWVFSAAGSGCVRVRRQLLACREGGFAEPLRRLSVLLRDTVFCNATWALPAPPPQLGCSHVS